MKVLVCGGRAFDDTEFIFSELDQLHTQYGFVPSSKAMLAASIASPTNERSRGIDLIEFPADWKNEGRHVALVRNLRMLNEGRPDLVVAFLGGGGTWHTCSHAEKMGVAVLKVDQPA